MMKPAEFTINGQQATALRAVLAVYCDGEPILLTMQGNGTLVAGFTMATVEIDVDGETEVN